MVQRLAAWTKLRSSSYVVQSQELATFSDAIDDINRSFRPVNIEIVDFYEQKETRLPTGTSALVILPHRALR